jgi:hypothetical protein
MNALTILLLTVSLALLVIGFQIWRLTSSRGMLMLTFSGSIGTLFSAYLIAIGSKTEATFIIPFLVGMLFAGRGLGTAWRSRREKELRLPSTLMLAAACGALYAGVEAFLVA